MASLSGAQFNITGASGTASALVAKSGWRAYVLPRGSHAASDSTGTLITLDSASAAARFAVNSWVQIGTPIANIRRVTAVGGNSISVNTAVTVAENDRCYLIGNTQPSTTGGSASYITPDTLIRQRDDNASDLFANSLVTSNSDGLIQWWSAPNFYDVLIQDGNRSLQGSIIDLPVGNVGGISTDSDALFGGSVTVNGAFGVTGWATFGSTVTMHAALGVTGWATFGSSVTVAGALGVTGTGAFGATLTVGGAISGTTLTVTGAATLGAPGVISGLSVTTGIFGVSQQPRVRLVNSSNQTVTSNTTFRLLWDTEQFDVGSLHSGSSSAINITAPGCYLLIGQVHWGLIVGATGTTAAYETTIRKNFSAIGFEVAEVVDIAGVTGDVLKQSVSGVDVAVAGDYYDLAVLQSSGVTQTIICTTGNANTQLTAVKLF